MRDVTDIRQQEAEHHRNFVRAGRRHEHVLDVLDVLTVGITIVDADGTLVSVHGAPVHDGTPGPAVGDNLFMATERGMWGGGEAEAAVRSVLTGLRPSAEFEYDDGDRSWLVRANPTHAARGGVVIEHIDVTERRKAERRLTELALRDPLTGLANRVLLREQLTHELGALTRIPGSVGVLYCDLDGFKKVNDRLGHDAGDALLRHVAARLQEVVRPTDMVSRFGGDEFVVLAPGADEEDLTAIAGRVLTAASTPVTIHGQEAQAGVSVGMASTGDPTTTAADLLRAADTALFRAKESGRGRSMRFRPDMGHAATRHARTEQLLRSALNDGRVETFLQPQPLLDGSDAGAGCLSFEALARCDDGRGRLLTARDFIDVAEQTGLVRPLGDIVFRQACRHAQQLRQQLGRDDIRVWVNLSPAELRGREAASSLLSVVEHEGVPASALGVEITERAALDDPSRAVRTLRHLRRAGVHVAVDDFGAGHATFHSLRDLPLTVIKLDRCFVSGVDRHAYDRAVVRAIQELAETLQVSTVAEGVERRSQLETLRELGCHQGQGYLFGAPASIDETLAGYGVDAGGS